VQSIDHDVLKQTLAWLDENRPTWLCTIVQTLGSSPRPVGSIVAVCGDGRQVGSVSGGCVEEDLLERIAAGEFTGARPQLVEYGLSAQENERLGLPCGGRMTLLLQLLGNTDHHWITDILASLEQRTLIERRVDLDTGSTTLLTQDQHTGLHLEDAVLRHCFGPHQRMLLVGAGQLAATLAELALAMDYEVIVTDPRSKLLDQWGGPEVKRLSGMPDDVVRETADDPHSIIITLTHDPRIDEMALMEALESRAWYVGALGSARTTAKRIERLQALDIPDAAIARMHAPVGLNIGSKTPIEIAVSIMAEVTALRRKQ